MSFFAVVHLLFLAVLAGQLRARLPLLASFAGLPGYLFSFGLVRFAFAWFELLLYAILGWGFLYFTLTWAALVLPVAWLAAKRLPSFPPVRGGVLHLRTFLCENLWFLLLAAFVVARFYAGLDEDHEGQTWVVFNFVDTAFHLSVANAFLEAPHFPPVDLDMPPLPLKYHFLADFSLAHLLKLGAPPLRMVWVLNLLNSAALVGALWATTTHWLRLPPRWILLAGCVFLFLNQGLINLLHYRLLAPPYFDATNWFTGILRFPYFNFESILTNLLEPQRALLFSMPAVLFTLDLLFGAPPAPAADSAAHAAERRNLLLAFAFVCLLPFAHIVGFAVLAMCTLPLLFRHGRWFAGEWRRWVPFFVLGCVQLGYLLNFGPSANPAFSGWDAAASMPLDEFHPLPGFARRVVFWFFVNGDFFVWSLVLVALALWRRRTDPAATSAGSVRVHDFLRQWRWYFAICGGFFVLINFYRYSYAWGDSNKFVFFLNFGLSLVIALGAAQWLESRRRALSLGLWWILMLVAVVPPATVFIRRVFLFPTENNLFFHRHEVAAARWLRAAGPQDLVLTAAFTDAHFVSPLAGQPTPAGIYADSNPNRRPGRRALIADVYEKFSLTALDRLAVRYICLSRAERRVYKLHPAWLALMRADDGVAFHAGEPEEFESVFIFDAQALLKAAPATAP